MKTRWMAAAAAGFIVAFLSVPAQAQTACIKEVFHKYCLGGDVQPLLKKHTPDRTATTQEGATQHVFADGGEQTTVTVVQGKIESVSRRQHPGVQSTYDQVEKDLKGLYGEPRRTSNAKGRTSSVWDRGEWRVVLTYLSARGDVSLTYRHEGLEAARKAGASTYNSSQNPKGY